MILGLKEELKEAEKIVGSLTADQTMAMAVLFAKLIDRGMSMEQRRIIAAIRKPAR